ncbi:hypothetical protein EE612_004972 [Oryza sativa]|nr:hypothetical protein EE612_004972 [Oryza sativa]KAF2951645.1 hypothetical protein DAI22_01g278200 [Oryza sativa Japonica Group]
MARPWCPDDAYACLSLLLLLLLPAAMATSYSSLCSFPAEAADLVVTAGEHQSIADRLNLPLPSDGYFSGGDKLLFASDDHRLPRSFSFFTRRAARTTDPAITHLVATVTLSGYRFFGGRSWRTNVSAHSVSFDLEGYYSNDSASAALCMVGSGSRARDDGLGVVIIPDVALRLRLPRPATLTRPFVTGRLEGPDFGAVTLVAYAEGDYKYGEAASCPTPPGAVRSESKVFDGNFTCDRLGALLRGSYTMEYAEGRAPSGFPLRQRLRSMHISEIYCGENGAVRAYMVFDFDDASSDAILLGIHEAPWRRGFQADGDEALVADGFWKPSQGRLCLRACRTVRSTVRESDCGIRIHFWFPAVWSIQQRSFVAGMIRNTRSDDDGDTNKMSGAISVSRTGFRGDLSDIKYHYTRVEDAKNYYHSNPELSKERNGRFPGNYSYRDFAFSLYITTHGGYGYASPVTLGSAMVDGGTLTADDAFSRHAVAEMIKQRLLSVSYEFDIHLYRRVNSSRAWNVSRVPDRWRVSAEGVYDTKSGTLCMVGCRVINSSSDCQILVTVQLPALGGEDGTGSISSLRKKSDTLFFETLGFAAYGAQPAIEAAQAISRVDTERIMLVTSMTLSCVFLVLQLRHARKNPDALPATSITMLAVLALGYMIPLVVNYEAMFVDDGGSRNRHFIELARGGRRWLELNEFVLRLSTMVAFVLQLRLLLLALSARSTAGASGGGDDRWAAERSTLWICLPLYIAGAILIWIPHIGDGHDHQPLSQMKSAIHVPPPPPPPLSDDLLSYAGLILDGFLLPQIVSNAFSASRVNAISPWFYVGGTAIRAAPHAYDGLRARGYVQRWIPSYIDVYAGPRDGLFSVAWDVVIPCGAAALAVLLFFQQRLGGDFLCCVKRRKPGGSYEIVSTSTL